MDADKEILAGFTTVSGTFHTESLLSCIIYPNPSDGIFNVHVPQGVWYTYFVYSIRGDLVRKGMSEGAFELDLSSYEKGIYLLNIQSENGVDIKKIIIR